MLIERIADASRLNALFNDAEVRPWVADVASGPIDVAPVVTNENNVALAGEFGTTVYLKIDTGIYEVHTAILPEGRGGWAREFADASVRWMFCGTDCVEILTRVPRGHVAAHALTRVVGFRQQFETLPECRYQGRVVPATVYSLMLQDWWLRASGMTEVGAEFHGWLNGQIKNGAPHPEDLAHNRVIGVALEMLRMRNTVKAIVFYNRWAYTARHRLIALVSVDPVQIRFDAGILHVLNGAFRVEPLH